MHFVFFCMRRQGRPAKALQRHIADRSVVNGCELLQAVTNAQVILESSRTRSRNYSIGFGVETICHGLFVNNDEDDDDDDDDDDGGDDDNDGGGGGDDDGDDDDGGGGGGDDDDGGSGDDDDGE
jgi:hypothetical protein